ncbi:MAG: TIGR02597 family protein, partial [Verrucomicrobiae bacterium]|nr:TIGR02597 family protein [Verrucomicrobiae bacterium]
MKQSVAILGSALLLATPLAADTNVVTTDPVGVMRYVFQANSDSSMSLPLHRPTEFAGAVGSVGSNWITAFATSNSPINWVNNDWTYGVGTNANNTYYAMFTTGALEGAWFQIT